MKLTGANGLLFWIFKLDCSGIQKTSENLGQHLVNNGQLK